MWETSVIWDLVINYLLTLHTWFNAFGDLDVLLDEADVQQSVGPLGVRVEERVVVVPHGNLLLLGVGHILGSESCLVEKEQMSLNCYVWTPRRLN